MSPQEKPLPYHYSSFAGPQRRASWGKNWLTDDGELLVTQRTPAYMVELGVDDNAPPLAATTFDGKPLNLNDYRGKYELIDFWAAWCAPCIDEIPQLKETFEKFAKDDKLAMIGVALDDDLDAAKKLVAKQGLPWVQVSVDGSIEGAVTRAYRAQSIPAIYLIGPDGKIIAKDLRGRQILQVVSKVLEKR